MNKWHKELDGTSEMLRCDACDSRVILEYYSKAVGLMGYEYCPYCGAKMQRPKDVAKRIEQMDFSDCPWK